MSESSSTGGRGRQPAAPARGSCRWCSALTVCSSFVDRVQLLVGGLELLVGSDQLLVGRLQLLVRGLELVDGRAAAGPRSPPARAPVARTRCWASNSSSMHGSVRSSSACASPSISPKISTMEQGLAVLVGLDPIAWSASSSSTALGGHRRHPCGRSGPACAARSHVDVLVLDVLRRRSCDDGEVEARSSSSSSRRWVGCPLGNAEVARGSDP